ncbi:MAG: diguanylate cyclase, partial [Novosphingobium sp.]
MCVRDQHRPEMVLLALAAALLAGASAMLSFHRAQRGQGRIRSVWAALSGLTLGVGAWSAHNIAVLGYLPGSPFEFLVGITLGALGLLLVCGVVSTFLLLRLPSHAGVLSASLFYGGAICVSHYLGMAAINMPATVRWDPEYITASVICALLLSLPTFALIRREDSRFAAGSTVACFGLLLAMSHMTGMTALEIIPGQALPHAITISPGALATWIGLVTFALFVLGLLIAISNYRALAALERSERQFATLVRNTSDYTICMLDRDGRISQWNAGAKRLTGYSSNEAVGMPIAELFAEGDHASGLPMEALDTAARTGICQGQWTARRRDGSSFWVDGTVEKVCDDEGRHVGFLAITHDITRIRQAQELAAQTAHRLDTALENMHEGLCLFDAEERLVLCNRRFRELWDLDETDTAPDTPLEKLIVAGFMNPDGRGHTAKHLWAFRRILDEALTEERVIPVVTELGDNRVISIANSPLPGGGWVTTCTDITEQRRSEARIEHLAFHDPLTGLPNRARYHWRLDHVIEQAAQTGLHVAAIAIDLDRFKEINDTYGHACGDQALQAMAERLIGAMDEGEVAARLGGDEFAAAKSFRNKAELDEFIGRLSQAIVSPVTVADQQLDLEASLGVAVYPQDGTDRES